MNLQRQNGVRVRVAPSPTGDPHVGTGYIALFNYAFARANGGRLILRIEDTDRERSTLESEEQILHSLHWLGLEWDEGPDVGGPYGPYRQSERSELYRRYAGQLLESGAAYACFCTPERLAELRKRQRELKSPVLGYDKHCKLNVSPEEARARIAAGEPYVIRLDVPLEGETIVRDLIRGDVAFRNSDISDQVLLKSDGFPTYHLANVVDDHLMEISHVIRAEEWIVSTPKHLLLYDAFGWERPVFVHMPLLRNPDKNRSKISKRKNPTSLLWYEREGYLPEALRNFLGLMGVSAEEGKEKFSLDEMIRDFDWKRVATGAPVFDLQKLDWLNGVYIREMAPDDLARRLRETVLKQHPASDDFVRKSLPLAQERMKKLSDYPKIVGFFFAESVNPPVSDLIPKKSNAEQVKRILKASEEAFCELGEWTTAALEQCGRALVERLSLKGRVVFMALRVAITGSRVSPPLFESMELLGREKSLARLRTARERIEASAGE